MSEEEKLSIMGKEIKFEYKTVNVSELKYYDKNPRIATIVSEHKGQVTEEVIDKDLWDRNETRQLMRQIEADGGLIHPVVVYRSQVLEGNTRLCCYRHLYDLKKDDRWRSIRCQVILDELSQEDIYRLLCTEHITGKIEWNPHDKANLFRKMKEEDGMKLEDMAKITGESTTTIFNMIRAYKLMVENGVTERAKYSHFEQLVRNSEIREIKQAQDPEIEEKVVELIKGGTVKKATDIRLIGTIYKHKDYRKRVFQGKEDVEQVYHEVKAKAPMTDSPIIKEVESLVGRIRELTREQRAAIKENKRDCSKIVQLTKDLLDLCREMDVEIHVPKKMQKGAQ